MVNYWLRTNLHENFAEYNTEFELWDTNHAKEYNVGDQFILYITKGPKQYFLVGIYKIMENRKARPITCLPENDWVPRPSVEDWKLLIGESVVANTNFDINNNRSWVGKVASQGLHLTESDFNKLKELITQ